jgi:positive regulator of sigma E activity
VVKLGHAFRLANRYANVDNAKRFAQHVVPEVVRPARIIWNQAIGAVFLVFAVYFLVYASMHRQNPPAVIGGVFMGLIMGFFAITSFRRARRISRL